jgi:hypothetical protein
VVGRRLGVDRDAPPESRRADRGPLLERGGDRAEPLDRLGELPRRRRCSALVHRGLARRLRATRLTVSERAEGEDGKGEQRAADDEQVKCGHRRVMR